MQQLDFDATLEKVLLKDPRYQRPAYLFLREALDHTQKRIHENKKTKLPKHVTGQQLLDGIRDYALTQFGPMSLMVLEEWGIHRCEDFGEMVFNLVESGLLSKTDEDTRKDFEGGYDFIDAFRKPFLPKRCRPSTRPRTLDDSDGEGH